MNIITPAQAIRRSSVSKILADIEERLSDRKTDSFPEHICLSYPNNGPSLTLYDHEIVAGILEKAGWRAVPFLDGGKTMLLIDLPRVEIKALGH